VPTAVIVQLVPHEGCGWLDDVLEDAAVERRVLRMWDGDAVPETVEADAFVVLGGPMGANDDGTVPWLRSVKTALSNAVASEVPTLGLCLGAQLLAVAEGGTVEKAPGGPELGLCSVRLGDEAASDALFSGMARDVDVVQWHWDHIAALPSGAVNLASTPDVPHQAFRVGTRAWGLQFHPEVTLPLVAQWAQDDRDGVQAAGLEPTALVGAVAESERRLLETWTPLLDRFADLAAGAKH
jgi:GMP synthase (glutamine-hydrolysing)